MNTKKTTPKLQTTLEKKMNELPTKSAKIRFLHSEGFSRGDISRILKIKYQHVRNVLVTPLKNA